jgi:hypothetical protein
MPEEFNPFQSPAAPSLPDGEAAWPIVPFESGHTRAVWTIILLAVVAVTSVASAGLNYSLYKLVLAGDVQALDSSGGWVGWTSNLAMVGAVIAFSMWTHRVYRNLPALGARLLRYTPGWAVGWLFVPFANLVIPYFVFAEIWRNSIPAPAASANGHGNRFSPLLIGWWIVNVLPFVVLVVGFVGFVVAVISAIGDARAVAGPGQVALAISEPLAKWFLLAEVVVPLIGSAAAVLTIFVVRRIDKNQQAKYEMICTVPQGK